MHSEASLDLVTVYYGPIWKILLIEGRLEAEGIPVLVPDRMIKTIDPFITGSNSLDLRLQVPSKYADAARALLAEEEDEERHAEELPPADAEVLELTRLGRRICFAVLIPFTSPWALWYAPEYLRRAAALDVKPRGHWLVLAAFALSVPMIFVAGYMVTHCG